MNQSSSKNNRGFANPILHKFASAKGGKVRVPKGLSKLSPERRSEIASMGGRKKYENKRNNITNSEENNINIADIGVEEILGILNEEKF